MEEASGLRQATCPWWAMRDPYVQRVVEAHGWREKGALDSLWPSPIPAALKTGIDVFGAALARVRTHDLEKEREERERQDRQRRAQPPHFRRSG